MEISIYAPYAKERFETARPHSILHPERIVGNPEVIPRNVGQDHLGNSKRAWPAPPWTDTILVETCHRMHDRSYRSGGRDGQERFAEGR
jgi:hypothetical protein